MTSRSWMAAIVAPFLLTTCASQLERDLTDNKPKGAGVLQIDLSQVTFLDVATGDKVNVASYMEATGKDYLLLTFGSTGCGICNSKNTELTENIVGKHALYATAVASRFEIIGVNTEREELNILQRKLRGNELVRWFDLGGAQMMEFFAAAGSSYAIPVTVFINREGIMLRKLPSDKYTVYELMAEVAASIGVEGEEPEPTDPEPTDPEPTDPEEEVPVTALDFPAPGRLKSVTVTNCEGAEVSLYDALGRSEVRLLQVADLDAGCDETCQQNAQTLTALHNSCAGAEATACTAITLVKPENLSALCAAGERVAAGGEEFWQRKYQALFDHEFRPVEEGRDYYLPPVTGPLYFAVHKDGFFADWQTGLLRSDSLQDFVAQEQYTAKAAADFPVFTDQGAETLDKVYGRSQFTVIVAWGTECSSCKEEIKHWAEEGQLEDFCAARPNFCQVYLHEVNEPDDPFTNYPDFYQGILNGWEGDFSGFEGLRSLGSGLPVLLDTTPSDGDGYLDRLFEGYLLARYPEWGFQYRTVIYDQEGKIIAGFIARDQPGEDDPVLEKLQNLLQDIEGDL